MNFDHLKMILAQATNEHSNPKPADITVSREFGAFLFGQEAIGFSMKQRFNGVLVIVQGCIVDMALNYGEYDPENYM